MIKYLETNNSTLMHFSKNIIAALHSSTLFLILVGCNVVQISSLIVYPFSRSIFRKINTSCAIFWWGLCTVGMEKYYGMNIVFQGDQLPLGENSLVICNHQSMADVPLIFTLAWRKKMLENLKWYVKDIIKYVPGPGWGMKFLNCIFLKRDWESDKTKINQTFSNITDNRIKIWLISFLEGTRISSKKLELATQFAATKGLCSPEHVLLPRTKGFVASISGLRGHITSVVDLTIYYPDGIPTLWQVFRRDLLKAFINIERIPIAALPTASKDLEKWVFEQYQKKDQLLATIGQKGHFPTTVLEEPFLQ
jgi:1-acyl-sn-glycerol-3-phosphate acyltransferase